jgi:hypothetical protein
MLSVIMQSGITFDALMQSVVMLSVVLANVVAPLERVKNNHKLVLR